MQKQTNKQTQRRPFDDHPEVYLVKFESSPQGNAVLLIYHIRLRALSGSIYLSTEKTSLLIGLKANFTQQKANQHIFFVVIVILVF